jgi:hypothetical protein
MCPCVVKPKQPATVKGKAEKFMEENGLGPEDMRNDISYPQER